MIQPPTQPLIKFGARAGRPYPITDICIDRLRASLNASISLKLNGYTVLDLLVIGRARPVVFVAHCSLCDEMIRLEQAFYVFDGHDPRGPRRTGQFLVDGVHVEWDERGRREPLRAVPSVWVTQ